MMDMDSLEDEKRLALEEGKRLAQRVKGDFRLRAFRRNDKQPERPGGELPSGRPSVLYVNYGLFQFTPSGNH
jgi:hypothetical protein